MAGQKLLLVGWDGADWEIARPLMQAGHLPCLSSIVRGGAAGPLLGFAPLVSPLQWTTLATGKHPDQHGVLSWCSTPEGGQAPRAIISATRRTKALWSILSEQGRRVAAVGWPGSYPAEPVHGAIVADAFVRAPLDRAAPWPLSRGTVYPSGLGEELTGLRLRFDDVDKGLLGLFIPRLHEIDPMVDLRPGILLRHLAQLYSAHNAAIALLGSDQPDFFTIYFPFLDAVSREFIAFHPPRHARVTVREYQLYSDVVTSAYRVMDALLADLLQHAPADSGVMVVSAHGYLTGASRPQAAGSLESGGPDWTRPSGIIAVRGPGVRQGAALAGASLVDVAPTILVWQGLAPGADMKGRVLSEMFDDLRVPKAGPSWDAAVPTVAPPDRLVYQPDAADAVQRTRELVEAGLVHPPELTSRRSAMTVAGENRWNLGIALLELRRPSEALPMLHEALLAMPESPVAAYYLVRCLFALGLIDEAEQAGRMFADSGPRNVRAEVLRAHILTARRKFEEALRVLGEVRELELTEERTTLQRHLLLQLGRFEEARAAFVEALTIAPEASHHYLGLAYALLGLRRREEACAAARQALARDCTLDSAKAILAGKYDDFARLSRKPPDFVGPSWEQLALDARPRILLRKEIRERERRFLVARREARAAEQPAGLTPACVSVAAVPAATDKPSAGQGSAAERASVRSPWRDEFARIDRAFLLPKAPSGTRRSWLWVMVAGEFERLVGVACLHEIAMPASATAAAGIEGGLDLAVRRNWQRDLGVRQLVNRALAQAQESGLRRVSVVTDPATALIESLTAAGFVEADRQEIRTIWVAALRGFFAGPRGQALTRQPVDVAPLAEASLDAVRRICSHYELLSPDRVHALGAVGRDGFDPRLSFFTGHPERPTAILLAREANGLAYLEVLARAPLVAEAPIPSALALLQAFVNAVHALGLMEINCAIQPAKNPGLASLIRRHGILLEGKAVYRWEKA